MVWVWPRDGAMLTLCVAISRRVASLARRHNTNVRPRAGVRQPGGGVGFVPGGRGWLMKGGGYGLVKDRGEALHVQLV